MIFGCAAGLATTFLARSDRLSTSKFRALELRISSSNTSVVLSASPLHSVSRHFASSRLSMTHFASHLSRQCSAISPFSRRAIRNPIILFSSTPKLNISSSLPRPQQISQTFVPSNVLIDSIAICFSLFF